MEKETCRFLSSASVTFLISSEMEAKERGEKLVGMLYCLQVQFFLQMAHAKRKRSDLAVMAYARVLLLKSWTEWNAFSKGRKQEKAFLARAQEQLRTHRITDLFRRWMRWVVELKHRRDEACRLGQRVNDLLLRHLLMGQCLA